MKTKAVQPITPEIVAPLAQQLIDYRLGGCPSGGGAKVQESVKKAAAKYKRSYSELWALVHAAAYSVIDAELRASLASTSPKS